MYSDQLTAQGGAAPQYDDVAPNASAMIESMRAYGYTTPAALADVIDNSIAAACSTVWVTFQWAGADSWVSIVDDGEGMTESALKDAMRLGSRNPLEDRSSKDLGRFGLGLKTASLSQCRRLTVTSRSNGQPQHVRRWDLDHLGRKDVSGWQLLRTAAPGSEARAEVRADLGTGTVVLWEQLDRMIGTDARVDDERSALHFREVIARVEAHLAMVFHRFLAANGRKRVRIFLNENEVEPWDPFLEPHAATQRTPSERIRVPGCAGLVVVQGFILPHKDRLGDAEHAAASGPAGWNAQQGFYLYRNERLIVAGSWLGLGSHRSWTQEEHYKLARIRLDIPNSMDHLWHLDVKKSSANPPQFLRHQLTGLAERVRQNARDVYAHRGKYRGRADREELARPWKTVRRSGMTAYRVDREHPIVAALVSAVPSDLKRQLEATLRIIEETVPVEQIWLDTAERPESPAAPFHGSTSKQMRTLIEIAYDALRRNRAESHAEAIQLLTECEEFASDECRAVIATLPSD
jgi:hypothetical protein